MNARTARNLRDPEDRIIDRCSNQELKEKMMDKTIADSFAASDPPSSLPNPDEDSFGSPWSKINFAVITIQAFAMNRLAGLPYPIWRSQALHAGGPQ